MAFVTPDKVASDQHGHRKLCCATTARLS